MTWKFWKWKTLRLSVLEVLHQLAGLLPIKNPVFKKYPLPNVRGNYFGFHVFVEGSSNKFLATFSLPSPFSERIFLQSERRKTSLKPIAELKLVHTLVEKFDQNFLLMASREGLAAAVFRPYLCEKILSLSERNWELDVHGKEAHFECQPGVLNAQTLADLLKVIVECLNALLTIS